MILTSALRTVVIDGRQSLVRIQNHIQQSPVLSDAAQSCARLVKTAI
ncbi:MAG: hypothetical protein RIQ79_293 [Verrucomicrobiota bacterium]